MAFWDDLALCAEAEAKVGLIVRGILVLYLLYYIGSWFVIQSSRSPPVYFV